MNAKALRQTASQILAACITELFPYVQIWEAQGSDTGFYCECYFPHPIHPDTLPLFEERMRRCIREKRGIRTLEMVPVSAAELLKKEGQMAQVEFLQELEENLVELIEMESYHGLSDGPHLKDTSQLSAFKLTCLEPLEDRGIRVEGVCAFSKEELKEFLKKLSSYENTNHKIIGQKRGFWQASELGWVWFKKGLEFRQVLQNIFLKEPQEAHLVECAGERIGLLIELAKGRSAIYKEAIICSQPLQNLYTSETRIQKTFISDQGSAISSLQSTHKSLMILGFHCWTRIAGKRQGKSWKSLEEAIVKQAERVERSEEPHPRVDLMVEDPLGRPWALASLRKEGEAIVCEAFVERILALLLEMNIGILPTLIERPNRDVQH